MKAHIESADESQEYFWKEGCFILELSNSSRDPGLSIARARVEPGRVTRFHRLTGTVERYVILEGLGRVEVGDLAPQEVKPGDVVIIPPDCDQRIANIGAVDLVFLAICTPRFTSDVYQDVQDERL
jgi:mannose-6-phosphate isomerase-like protein (cupin superfamily)